MYVDVWAHVARRQIQVIKVEKLWKMKLVKRSPTLVLLVTYYKVTNAVLKQLLKAQVYFEAFLWRVRK
jgi:hypothetical protein